MFLKKTYANKILRSNEVSENKQPEHSNKYKTKRSAWKKLVSEQVTVNAINIE